MSEPIVSATLAEILVRQGHLERAADMYAELVSRSPDEPTLAARHEEVLELLADARSAGTRERKLRVLLSRIQRRRRDR